MELETLKACRAMKQEIDSLLERIEIICSALERTTTVIRETGGGTSGAGQDKLASQVVKLMELEEELRGKVVAREEKAREIDEWLETLKPEERIVMRLRYVEGLSWGDVAKKAHYGRTNIWQIQKRSHAKLNCEHE